MNCIGIFSNCILYKYGYINLLNLRIFDNILYINTGIFILQKLSRIDLKSKGIYYAVLVFFLLFQKYFYFSIKLSLISAIFKIGRT